MKRLFPAFALIALTAAIVAIAEQTSRSAQPPPDANQSQNQTMPQSEAAPPSDTSNGISKVDKKELMESTSSRLRLLRRRPKACVS